MLAIFNITITNIYNDNDHNMCTYVCGHHTYMLDAYVDKERKKMSTKKRSDEEQDGPSMKKRRVMKENN